LQLAEAIATAQPFLGVWKVPHPKTVLFFETEMSNAALGKRLAAMFHERNVPSGVNFASEKHLRQFKRAPNMEAKFLFVKQMIAEAGAEVVIIDTCNPFFRGKESPNDETTAGAFFDLLEALPAPTKLFVRHNHKPRMEDSDGDGASRIRGSGQFADVPDLLAELRRTDKRTNEAKLSITKFRHGTKPDDLTLWFDRRNLQLIAHSPVLYLLGHGPLSRRELIEGLGLRFGVSQRLADEMIGEQKSLLQYQRGHERVFEIDGETTNNETSLPVIEDSSS
jgi:RecA-family ATPase